MLPLAVDTVLPVAPSHLEATADAATPPVHPAVITHPLATVAATNLLHHPATVSVLLHAAVVAVVVVAAAEVAAAVVANHITVAAAAAVVVVIGPHHLDARPPQQTSTHHRVAVVAAATVDAMNIPRPDAAAGTRTTRTQVPTEAVGLAVGGITKKPIEGVR